MIEEIERYGFFIQSHEDELGFMAKTKNGDFVLTEDHEKVEYKLFAHASGLNSTISKMAEVMENLLLVIEGKMVMTHDLRDEAEGMCNE